MLFSSQDLIGYSVHAEGEEIGHVHDWYFSDDTWAVRYAVVETGPWLFGRRFLVSPIVFDKPIAEQEVLRTDLAQKQIETSPAIDLTKPVSRQQEAALHDYYRWPYYWMVAPGTMGYATTPGIAMPTPDMDQSLAEGERQQNPAAGASETQEEPESDPHLRSFKEVTGYRIHALDGDIGHAEDFLIDDTDWSIRHMVIDTRNWLPGRKVLAFPDWIEKMSWSEAKIYVDATRTQIEESPEYEPTS